jgi:Ca2+:H+ antiporter
VVKRFLFGSLLVAPLAIVLHYAADLSSTAEFVLSAVALVPLAWLIGEATEHAAEHTGPGIGGFLNATFGNAPELIIALLAVHEGLTEVVRGSLTGSVIGNLLLVLGFSLVAGGKGKADRLSSLLSFCVIGVAVLLFLIPAIPGWHGDPERHSIAVISVPISIVLLAVYSAVTIYSGGIALCTSPATRRSKAGRSRFRSPCSVWRPWRRRSLPRFSSAPSRSSPISSASPTSSLRPSSSPS